jgi:hypothetical protein
MCTQDVHGRLVSHQPNLLDKVWKRIQRVRQWVTTPEEIDFHDEDPLVPSMPVIENLHTPVPEALAELQSKNSHLGVIGKRRHSMRFETSKDSKPGKEKPGKEPKMVQRRESKIRKLHPEHNTGRRRSSAAGAQHKPPHATMHEAPRGSVMKKSEFTPRESFSGSKRVGEVKRKSFQNSDHKDAVKDGLQEDAKYVRHTDL